MSKKTAIIWFRQDLRLTDNPALIHAVENGYKILPVFILDDGHAGDWKMGGASRWWLHKCLEALNSSLKNHMVFRRGEPLPILKDLIEATGAQAVFWGRRYEPWAIARDKEIKSALQAESIEVQSFNASLLWEPWTVQKDDGTPYKVFTPFYRKKCLAVAPPPEPKPAPQNIEFASFDERGTIQDLDLLPQIPWHTKLEAHWKPGEDGARKRLDHFLTYGLNGYKELRNRPDLDHVSMMSPYLHFGDISPRTVWYAAQERGMAEGWKKDTDHFCSELGWREFSYNLLYHFPDLPRGPLQKKFAAFPWDENAQALERWQTGHTGIPIVDAGMRQLWETGWMHNRVRMIVASLLVKNMLIHWHHGEDWFWDTLVDADLANNAASWQWVAGCGADAAPYFRIFNPVTQGEKFDPDGAYVRKFVPELADVPDTHIHKPWEMGVPPSNYPAPIVDLKGTRQKALDAYAVIKGT